MSSYPNIRLRRLRQHSWIRDLVRETTLDTNDLIWPLFVMEGKAKRIPIATMPGVYRFSIDVAVEEAKAARDLGIRAIALFPVVEDDKKSEQGKEALNSKNLLCRAVKAIKKAVPEIGVICDVALDPYTTHGHDGIFKNGEVQNDLTVDVLCRQALLLAEAGADIVAPSDMMDGRVLKIRQALDAKGFQQVLILSYAAKFASCLYGPFRGAVGSAKRLAAKGKQSYQLDPANRLESLREAFFDVSESADMIMVKPGSFYLDVLRDVARKVDIPVFAYQVSGEYAMIRAASERGFIDEKAAVLESFIGFKRAGARAIVSYYAMEAAQWLKC